MLVILDRAAKGQGGPDTLVQRHNETVTLDRMLQGVQNGVSAAAVVIGAPGTGRTSLLAHAARKAHDSGIHVMTATGAATESGLNFGVVSQLLLDEPDIATLLGRLSTPDETTIPALCGYFLARSRRTPLLIVVDDAHLADEQSRLWLRAMIRRLNGTSMMLLFSGNSTFPQPPTEPAWTFGEDLPMSARHHVLPLAPLDLDGVAEVVRRRRGSTSPDVIQQLTAATQGNPAVLSAALAQAAEPDQVGEAAAMARGIRRERTGALLAQLPPDVVSLLRCIAVAGQILAKDLVGVLADLGEVSLCTAIEQLRDYGLIQDHDGHWVMDDVVTQCVLATVEADERAHLHNKAAELAHKVSSPDDDVATLLLGAAPVGAPWAADVLSAAAASSTATQYAHDPAPLLRRALCEPVSASQRAELLVRLAEVETTGRPDEGDQRLTRVVLGDDGGRFAAADLLLIRGAVEVARQLLGTTQGRAGISAEERTAISAWRWLADDLVHSGRDAVVGETPDGPTETHGDPDRAAIAAWRIARLGEDAARARELARQALSTVGDGCRGLFPRLAAVRTLTLTDDVTEAMAGVDQVLVDARRRGLPSAVSLALINRSQINHIRGRTGEASEDLNTAMAVHPLRLWHPARVPMVLGSMALLRIEQGRIDDAERMVNTPLPPGADQSVGMSGLLFARGLMHLNAGRFQEALHDLLECGRRLLHKGWHNPAVLPWRSPAALAYSACGRPEDANRLFRQEWALAQRWGTPSLLGGISLWHSQVLRGHAAWQKLSFAVRMLRHSPARSWYAEALYQLASHQAVAGNQRTAENLLTDCERLDAMQEAGQLKGNVRTLAWRLRVSRRLADVSGTEFALSDTATRVTELVALGVSTPAIADTLSVSRRSVEQHLTTVYRAFGVNGRAELRAVFDEVAVP